MELNDTSMYDIVKENLTRRRRKMYVHRLVYIFNYEVEPAKEYIEAEEDIVEKFGELVDQANFPDRPPCSDSISESLRSLKGDEEEVDVPDRDEEEGAADTRETFDQTMGSMMLPENIYYHDEHLSGVLFSYNEPIGIHILEGSDAMLMKHIESLFKREFKWTDNLKHVKLLCTFHHVYKRIVTKWTQLEVIPPVPSQPIEPPVTDEDHCELLEKCLIMLGKVKDYLISGDSSYSLKERYINRVSINTLMGKLNKLMPPIDLLKHLLNSPMLEDLKVYSYRLSVIPKPIAYHETVWPIPTTHVPDFHDILMQKGESFYEYTIRMKNRH